MTKALLAHPGTQYSFHLAKELARHGKLLSFHTGFAIRGGGIVDIASKALPRSLQRRLSNRRLSGLPADKLRLHPLCEVANFAEQWLAYGSTEASLHRRNERFQAGIDRKSIENSEAVIGFDTSSWLLAKRCREAGVRFVLDQSIGHPDTKGQVYKQIQSAFPEWSSTVDCRLPIVRGAEQIEHDLAALIVAASSFTVRTLMDNGVAPDKIRVNPYGVDVDRFVVKAPNSAGPIRFIFVGSITARKGIPLLIEAWRLLNTAAAELWLVGPIADHVRSLIPPLRGLRIFGAIPHRDVPHLLRQCDVLVFPSYFEGFGLVIPEAMACGLPVIATEATAAPDIYQDANGGWIVPVGDVEALASRLDICSSEPHRARAMGRVARAIAEKLTWHAYGDRWVSILDGLHEGRSGDSIAGY